MSYQSLLMCLISFIMGLFIKKLFFKLLSILRKRNQDNEKEAEADEEIDFEEEDLKMVEYINKGFSSKR